jgi:hypothetical protein
MKAKGKSGRSDLSGLLGYNSGKMPDRERNTIEREFQKDPFANEAAEGLSLVKKGEAEKDIASLGKRLSSRVEKRHGVIFYRIAASVAVLMILSSIFVVIEKKKPSVDLARTTIPEVQAEIASQVTDINKAEEVKAGTEKKEAMPSPAASRKNVQPATTEKNDVSMEVPLAEMAENRELITADEAVSIPLENKQEAVIENVSAERELFDDKAKMGIPESKSAVAGRAIESTAVYTQPVPEGGMESFRKYINDNRINPGISESDTVKVILTFLVKADGEISSIKSLKSPGKKFTIEAIRLLKEGPKWIPAERGGIRVNDEVKVEIEFR